MNIIRKFIPWGDFLEYDKNIKRVINIKNGLIASDLIALPEEQFLSEVLSDSSHKLALFTNDCFDNGDFDKNRKAILLLSIVDNIMDDNKDPDSWIFLHFMSFSIGFDEDLDNFLDSVISMKAFL